MFPTFFILFITTFGVVARRNELVLQGDENIEEVIKTPRPYFNASELPLEYDLRKTGLLSTDLNQHIPVYW